MVDKEAVSYHPERSFRKRRRERNPAKRRQRKRYYLKNKAKIRQKQRQRRKQLKRNPMYKKRQQQLRRERSRRHMLASRVASAWRIARSWITPNLTRVQLDEQNIELPMRQFDSMMKSVARLAGGVYDEDSGEIDFKFDPSLQPAYSKIRVLYRFLPDGTVCFDTIPITPRGPSNRLKAYRSFHGEYDDIQDLYKEFLAWLRYLVAGVRKYKSLQTKKRGNLKK